MNEKNTLTGTSLVGGSVNYERVENDYYATDPDSTRAILERLNIHNHRFYEPCAGGGHISEVLKEKFPNGEVISSDLVYRGYEDSVGGVDFLKDDVLVNILGGKKAGWVITNPPYKHAKEFIDKSLEIADVGVAMFLKIQFLEGQARKKWFEKNPPKYVYVFSKRQDPWRDGEPLNPKTGKKWGSTMCFAWFVWQVGYKGETVVKWI